MSEVSVDGVININTSMVVPTLMTVDCFENKSEIPWQTCSMFKSSSLSSEKH